MLCKTTTACSKSSFEKYWFCLILMLYILFGNFHKILEGFPMRLGLHIDIETFIWYSKFQIDVQIYITTQHNFLKYRNIKKIIIMWPFSFLTRIDFTSELDFLNSSHSFLIWLWKVWKLSLGICLVHFLINRNVWVKTY